MKKFILSISLILLFVTGAMAQSATLKVWIDSQVVFKADSSTVSHLTLYENDGDQGYTSFNMEFILPKGIHVNKVKQGRDVMDDIFLSERATSTHTIACNMPADSILRVACISTKNLNLYNDDEDGNPIDAVWTIGLIADPSMVNGDYEVIMPADGLVFNMEQDGTYVSSRIEEDLKCIFTITNGQITAIKQVNSDKDTDTYYDLNGRKVTSPKTHGVYIHNGKKVLK